MRRLSPIIALVLLVLAAPAAAKKVSGVQLCGAGGCAELGDHSAMQAFHEGGAPANAPTDGLPWYRAIITVHAEDASDTFQMAVVPAARLMRSGEKVDGGYLWTSISPDAAEAIAGAAGALEPFPASKLAGTGPQARHKVVVHGVVRPAARIEDDGGGLSAAWVGGAGAVLLLGAGALGLRRHRRGRS